MNKALFPFGRRNDDEVLNTCPVGAGGVETTNACGTPAPLYSVDTFVTWSEIQNGLVALNDIPQGFFRLTSVLAANPLRSDVKLVWLNIVAAVSDNPDVTKRLHRNNVRGCIGSSSCDSMSSESVSGLGCT